MRFNVDPLNNHDDAEVERMIKKSGLDKLLTGDDLLNHEIKSGGGNLSAGEQQLICICRALLRKNKVVIMDEATANVDVVTEAIQLKLLKDELQGSTVMTIAHRLNTIIKSNVITCLSEGRVKEFGTPQELAMRPESEFCRLLQDLEKSSE